MPVTTDKEREKEVRTMGIEPLIDVGSWDDEDEDQGNEPASSPHRSILITPRDGIVLSFLTRYGFAPTTPLARLTGVQPESIRKRMDALRAAGFVKNIQTPLGWFWVATPAGIDLSGFTLPPKEEIRLHNLHHSLAVTELAAELEAEHPHATDVLGVEQFGESFPVKHRNTEYRGADTLARVWGSDCVAEREILQSLGNQWGTASADARRAVEEAAADPTAPETAAGNEWMFVAYGDGGRTGRHTPDLVVLRPRAEDGTPQHIAVEFERTRKPREDQIRIFKAFKEQGLMFGKVVYFTPSSGIRNHLLNVAEEVGLGNLTVRKYQPYSV
tara:strand:+ start:1074 stop:2060 length:987 start_codon:yes stop_codon:yes gene_type:complete